MHEVTIIIYEMVIAKDSTVSERMVSLRLITYLKHLVSSLLVNNLYYRSDSFDLPGTIQ